MMNYIQIFAEYAVLIITILRLLLHHYYIMILVTKIFNKLEVIFIYLKLIADNQENFFSIFDFCFL